MVMLFITMIICDIYFSIISIILICGIEYIVRWYTLNIITIIFYLTIKTITLICLFLKLQVTQVESKS